MLSYKNLGLWMAGTLAGGFLLTASSIHADTNYASDANLPTGNLGTVSAFTLPASGVISSAQGIAYDPNGTIVVSYYGGTLNRYSSTGVFLANLANAGSGNGGVAVDLGGNIYLSHGAQVNRYASDGTPLSPITGLDIPLGLTLDSAGNLYVVDAGNQTVKKYAPGGTLLFTFSGGLDSAVNALVTDAGHLLVTNYNTHTITEFAADGTNLGSFATGLSNPWGMALSGNGNLLVANRGNNTVVELSSAGALVNTYSTAFIPTYVATTVLPATPVPEPSAFGMVALGAFGLTVLRRRR